MGSDRRESELDDTAPPTALAARPPTPDPQRPLAAGTADPRPGAANARLGTVETSLGTAETSLGTAETSLGTADTSLGTAETSLGTADTSLGTAETSLGTADTSLGTAETSLGTADTSLGTAETSLGTEDAGVGLATGPEAASTSPRVALGLRAAFLAVTVLAAGHIVYFALRFLVLPDPPALHASFVGRTGSGTFASLEVFDGPYLTLVRMLVIAILFLVVAVGSSRSFRHDPVAQNVATIAVIAGQFSLAVAVLTSSEPLLGARIAAATIYVLMPLAAFTLVARFPNGRSVPRWSLHAVPVAVAPFVAQAVVMFREREYSVRIAALFVPVALLFLWMQWHRYRNHATVRDRMRIKWLCYAGVAYIVLQAIAVIGVIPLLADRTSDRFPFVRILFELLIAASYLGGLASLLFSGARYRVWDIDRVINRTIVYGVVTFLLVAASVVSLFGLRALFESALPDAVSFAIAIALVVGVAPLVRRRIARWIDRTFYGIGLDYEALAAKAVRAAQGALPTTGGAFASYDELVLLGRGGMGAVYRAHHPQFRGPVALKVMSPKLADDADAQARFERESQILEDLKHPNVIPFLASGHERGLAFIAMQFVEGEDLGALVRRRGALSPVEVAPLVTGVAAALDLAHARGVVHRDVKPANVFVEGPLDAPIATRRALLMDFGVARLADDSRAPDASLVGSLPYIAPEQVRDADAVDARADVYSLGATVFELVTGRPPFVESTALGMVLAHLHRPVIDPRVLAPSLSEPAARAIVRALAKQPQQRFASAGAFAAAFAAATPDAG